MASELEVGKVVADSGIVGTGTAVVTTAKPTLAITDTSVGGSVTIRGKSPLLSFDRTDSGTGTILTDGGGLNIKSGTLDSHGSTHFAIASTGAVVVGDTPNAASGAISDLHVNKAAGGTLVLSRTTGDNNGTLGTVRFGNTDTDSTLANIIATEAGTKTSSKLEFQTQTTGQAADTRLTIGSDGLCTFANGIAVNTTVTNPGNGNLNTGASITDLGRMHLSTTSSDHTVNRNSDGNLFEMRRSNGAVGSIAVTTSATAFNTSSDYRLKENLTPLTGALDRLDQLPVYRFNFKTNPDTTVDGFVAHEVSAHVPEAVTGEKDAMKTVVVQEAVEAVEAQPATYWEEGDELPEGVAVGDEKTAAVEAVEAVEEVTEEQPDYQGIDQSKLVPLLVAAVKELKAKVEALEGGE